MFTVTPKLSLSVTHCVGVFLPIFPSALWWPGRPSRGEFVFYGWMILCVTPGSTDVPFVTGRRRLVCQERWNCSNEFIIFIYYFGWDHFSLSLCIISSVPAFWGPWLIWCKGTGRQQRLPAFTLKRSGHFFIEYFSSSLLPSLLWLSRDSHSLSMPSFSVIKFKLHCLSRFCHSTRFLFRLFPHKWLLFFLPASCQKKNVKKSESWLLLPHPIWKLH